MAAVGWMAASARVETPALRTSRTSQEESMVEEKEDRHSILHSRTKFKVGATLSGNRIGLATAGGHL